MTFPSNLVLLLALCSGLVAALHAVAWRRTAAVAHGRRLELSLSPAEALAAAEAAFPAEEWTPTDGDGTVNRAHRHPGRPSVSVEAVPAPQGSEVHVWMSDWTVLLGVVRHAAVARAQFDALEAMLLTADDAHVAEAPCDLEQGLEAVPARNFSTEVVATIHALTAQRAGRSVVREHAVV